MTGAPDSSPATLEGFVSINAALYARSRDIHTIYIQQEKRFDRQMTHLRQMAETAGVPVEVVGGDVIAAYAGGNTHGGVVALVGERHFVSLDDLQGDNPAPFIVMLDGVEDPYNFGYAVRSLYAAGADGLVVRPRNWTTAAAVVARASAGASERIPMAIAETAQDAADAFRARGLTIATTARTERAVSLYEADLSAPLFVLIGGEKRGVTRSFVDAADLVLRIPYGRDDFAQSLGTVAAASIITFEVMRQRGGYFP